MRAVTKKKRQNGKYHVKQIETISNLSGWKSDKWKSTKKSWIRGEKSNLRHNKLALWCSALTLKSDKYIISPHNITPESYIKVMRIKKNDHQLKQLLIIKQILFSAP